MQSVERLEEQNRLFPWEETLPPDCNMASCPGVSSLPYRFWPCLLPTSHVSQFFKINLSERVRERERKKSGEQRSSEGKSGEERGGERRERENREKEKKEEDFNEEKNKLMGLLYDANQNFHVDFNQTLGIQRSPLASIHKK